MGCVPLDTPESRIRELEYRLKTFFDYAMAHQKWEAELLCDDGPWFDEMPEDLMTGFENLQALRNHAMGS